MKTSSLIFVVPLVLLGCGSDDAGTTTKPPADTGSSTDTGSPADSSGEVAADTGSGGDTGTGGDTGVADTGSSGDSSSGDTGSDAPYTPSPAAKYFCDGYKSICGFTGTGYFTDYDTCAKSYDSWGTASHTCVGNELGKKNCAGAACTAAPCTPCK